MARGRKRLTSRMSNRRRQTHDASLAVTLSKTDGLAAVSSTDFVSRRRFHAHLMSGQTFLTAVMQSLNSRCNSTETSATLR